MAQGTFYKTFGSSDRTTTRTLLHEAIPITGTIVTSGSHSPYDGGELNSREYSHGMFQSIYDYPFLSSSANHLFDITVGIRSASHPDYENADIRIPGNTYTQNQIEKKVNVYDQMSQVLMGYDLTGSARAFDTDGDLSGGAKINSAIFINFSRLLVKDEIKKGSFNMEVGLNDAFNDDGIYRHKLAIADSNGSDGYFVNSPAGEYGIVYGKKANALSTDVEPENTPVGLLFYQAGVLVLTSSFMQDKQVNKSNKPKGSDKSPHAGNVAQQDYRSIIQGSSIQHASETLRNRITNISFNNTTELNSTVYFCRANHNEFNYSSNPTYLDGSKIRVKDNDIMVPPRSYITTVGLYSADNELLAVAKLSEPLRKDPTNELTLRVRLDY